MNLRPPRYEFRGLLFVDRHRQEMLVQRAKPTRSAALAGDYELTYLKAAGADSLARGPLFVMFIDFDLPATVVQKLFAASA